MTIYEILNGLGITYEEYQHRGDGVHVGDELHHLDNHDNYDGYHDDDDDHDALYGRDHHDDDHDDDDGHHDDGADHIPGIHPNCLFVENRDGHKHYLVIVASNKRTDMAKLAQSLGARRLSFGSKKPLLEWLHATPGTVSPFGLIYDTQKNVSVVIDEELLQVERVGFHTHDDTSTLVVSLTDLLVYLNATAKSVSTLAL